ncbi:MAG: ABC-2 family transporter protein [Candidatus Cloacimonetes bacterium]|nr:ABC-2 family transporter protein [Candidatus Cloacimonadota bacterium]
MKNILKHYASVYHGFLQTSLSEATSFRLNFFLFIIMDIIFFCSSVMSVHIIYQHIEKIGIWSLTEFMFFLSFSLLVDQIHMAFIAENFWYFSDDIRMGNLDFFIIKPISTIFSVFFRHIRPASCINILFTGAYFVYCSKQAGLSNLFILVSPLFVILALLLMVSLEILLSCSMFFMVESMGINFLRMQFQKLSRWPDFVYGYMSQKVFTFAIPILLISNAPIKFLLNPTDITPLLYMLIAIVVTILLIRIAWAHGLRAYESVSS